MAKPTKRSRGRPAGETMKQIAVRFPEAMLDAIDEIVEARIDKPERSAIIRELVADGLAARKKGRR